MYKSRVRRKVTWGDLDPMGIVFYPRFYEWIDEAAHLFFDRLNLNLNNLFKEKKLIFMLVETGARYIKPVRYHDEVEIVTYVKEIQSKVITLHHEIINTKDQSRLVEGYEKRVCVQVMPEQRLKAIPIPADIRKKLS